MIECTWKEFADTLPGDVELDIAVAWYNFMKISKAKLLQREINSEQRGKISELIPIALDEG